VARYVGSNRISDPANIMLFALLTNLITDDHPEMDTFCKCTYHSYTIVNKREN